MKVSFHTSLLSAARPPELIPNPSKEERRAGGRAGEMPALPPGARRVLGKRRPPHKSDQADAPLVSQTQTLAYFQETFLCWISGM